MDEASFIASFGRSFRGLADDFWPDRPFACTATDALSGAFVLWDRAAKVGLARAVASSCSLPGIFPPITIRGRRYIDGGMHSGWIADITKEHDIVVVVAMRTMGGDPALVERMRRGREAEIANLRKAGLRVELIVPDPASMTAVGDNTHYGTTWCQRSLSGGDLTYVVIEAHRPLLLEPWSGRSGILRAWIKPIAMAQQSGFRRPWSTWER
jgi:predicted acylesterase/phospholipase RssA